MKKTLLYMLTFPSGKSYIGITTRALKRRLILHLSHTRLGRDNAVHRAIRKYGKGCIFARVLAIGPRDYILYLEKKAIAAFGTFVPNGYNQSGGGEAGNTAVYTEERRAKMSAARLGKNLGNKFGLGYRHTPEAREKISQAGRARIFSAEAREKIGASKVGNTYGTGRYVSEESRRKSSEKQKGKPKSAEARARMSAAKKGKPWSPARRAALEKKDA